MTFRGVPARKAGYGLAVAGLVTLLLWLPVEGAEDPGGALTTETVEPFLRRLGYEPETIQSVTGGTWGYALTIKQGGRAFYVEVQVSSDTHAVWLIAPLQFLPAPPQLSVARLLRLLEENDRIGPASFACVSSRIHLNLPLPNHGLTPARFRQHLEAFLKTIARTEPLWNASKWASEEVPRFRAPIGQGAR